MPVRTNTYVGVAGWWGTMGIAEGCYTLMVMEVALALVLVLVLVDRVLVRAMPYRAEAVERCGVLRVTLVVYED